MIELVNNIPDVSMLLALEPEELARRLLVFMRAGRGVTINPSNCILEIWNWDRPDRPRYPDPAKDDVNAAIHRAFRWLEDQGYLVPDSNNLNAINGWKRLTRRALEEDIEKESDFSNFRNGRLLSRRLLHPRIAACSTWDAFIRADYGPAVFEAMKTVEIAVREAAKLTNSDVGRGLANKAFQVIPAPGPLTDTEAQNTEQDARRELFAGALGSYKNPGSHRDVEMDPTHAFEAIMLANLLMRIVDSRVAAIA